MGVIPAKGTFATSFKVIVTVEVAIPFAVIDVVPVMLEFAAVAAVLAKVTVPPATLTGVSKFNCFISARVEAKVQVETPEALVLEQIP